MNATPLPKILENAKRLPQSRFHNEALASRYGISYADVLTQFGKLKEGVEIIGYTDVGMNEGCYEVMFLLPTGEQVYFHYFSSFFTQLNQMRELGIDVEKTFVSSRKKK